MQPLKRMLFYWKYKLMSDKLVLALNCSSASELLGQQLLCANVKGLLTSHRLNSLFNSNRATKIAEIEYIFARNIKPCSAEAVQMKESG